MKEHNQVKLADERLAEMLACPFCGSDGRLRMPEYPIRADVADAYVQCGNCDGMGPQVMIDNDVHDQSDWPDIEAEAIAAWNRRALEPQEAEPVAWQVMLPGGHEGAIHRIEEEAQAVASGFKTAFVRPLFLSPSTPQPVEVTEEMVERAAAGMWRDSGSEVSVAWAEAILRPAGGLIAPEVEYTRRMARAALTAALKGATDV